MNVDNNFDPSHTFKIHKKQKHCNLLLMVMNVDHNLDPLQTFKIHEEQKHCDLLFVAMNADRRLERWSIFDSDAMPMYFLY